MKTTGVTLVVAGSLLLFLGHHWLPILLGAVAASLGMIELFRSSNDMDL